MSWDAARHIESSSRQGETRCAAQDGVLDMWDTMDNGYLLGMCLDIVCGANMREQARTCCIPQDSVLDMQDIVDFRRQVDVCLDIRLGVDLREQARARCAARDGAADMSDSLDSGRRVDVCVDIEWSADARGHATDSWPFLTREDLIHHTADTSACQTLLDSVQWTPLRLPKYCCTPHMPKTFKGVTRHAKSTNTAGIFSMLWARLHVSGTGRDTHGQTSRPPDTTCVRTLDMSRRPQDKAPFLIVWLTAACKHRLPCLPYLADTLHRPACMAHRHMRQHWPCPSLSKMHSWLQQVHPLCKATRLFTSIDI